MSIDVSCPTSLRLLTLDEISDFFDYQERFLRGKDLNETSNIVVDEEEEEGENEQRSSEPISLENISIEDIYHMRDDLSTFEERVVSNCYINISPDLLKKIKSLFSSMQSLIYKKERDKYTFSKKRTIVVISLSSLSIGTAIVLFLFSSYYKKILLSLSISFSVFGAISLTFGMLEPLLNRLAAKIEIKRSKAILLKEENLQKAWRFIFLEDQEE